MKRIQLSIDDFGTGYAMMRQLQNVPATELKIDKSLIENLHANDSDRVMVEKIIEMGHELHLEVMAEGVKTREQFDLLREMGCDGAQGLSFQPSPQRLGTGGLACRLLASKSIIANKYTGLCESLIRSPPAQPQRVPGARQRTHACALLPHPDCRS